MRFAKTTALTLLLASTATLANPAPYREYTPMPFYEANVAADTTNTYRHWRDPERLDESQMSGDNQWKLNWKFKDEPYNDSLHGGHIALDRGETVYKQLNAKGRFAKCIGAKNNDLRGLRANHYPQYNSEQKQVVNLEMMIEHCAAKEGMTLLHGSYDNSAVSVYIASFSAGMPLKVDVSKGPLKESFDKGMKLFHTRGGWTNFSCATCHTQIVGMNLRGQTPTSHFGDAAHWPTWRTKDELQALHVRFTECNRNAGVQPLKIGSKEYVDIEVFLNGLSNGYPVVSPSTRD